MRKTLLSVAMISAFAASALTATVQAAQDYAWDNAPVTVARRGADDPAGHDVGDDHGRRGGRNARRGADDPAGHDVGDDHGRRGRRA